MINQDRFPWLIIFHLSKIAILYILKLHRGCTDRSPNTKHRWSDAAENLTGIYNARREPRWYSLCFINLIFYFHFCGNVSIKLAQYILIILHNKSGKLVH